MPIILGLKHFFESFYYAVCSVFAFLVGGFLYLLGYPGKTTVLTMVLVFFVLDVVTKIYSIAVQNGGLVNAFVNGKISSRSFWNGFFVKTLGYTTVLIIANFASITPEINVVGDIASSILYGGLFFYEVISNLENLVNAGFAGLKPLLNKLKREQERFLNDETTVIQENNNDSNSSI